MHGKLAGVIGSWRHTVARPLSKKHTSNYQHFKPVNILSVSCETFLSFHFTVPIDTLRRWTRSAWHSHNSDEIP